MKFKAIIRNAEGKEIENQIPHFAYQLISETLITAGKSTGINPLKKYNEMPFHNFFASCVHNFLSEVSLKLDEPEPTMIAVLTKHIQSIGGAHDSSKVSAISAIERFFNMITAHIGARSTPITEALDQLIQGREADLDNEPYISQCLDLMKRFDIPGITHIEFTPEENTFTRLSETRKAFSLFESQIPPQPTRSPLERLYQRYQVSPDDPSKLLRVIASTPHMGDLKDLSSLVAIETIINNQSPTGKTALHWLVKKAQQANETLQAIYQETYTWLIDHGADTTLLDSDDKAALEYDTHNLFGTFLTARPS